MTNRLRPSDMVGRISGGEFLLLLSPFDSREQICSTVDAILNDLKQPFHIDSFEVFTSCSIGISTYPDHGQSYQALRCNADSAMYRAKNSAKGEAIFFDADMRQAFTFRMDIEQRLLLATRDRKCL